MVKNSLAFLAVVAMVLFVQPVRADVLYDSGVAWNATNGQYGISGTGYVADPFTLSSGSTITSIDLGMWNGELSPPNTLSYAIFGATGPALYGGTVTLATLQHDPNITSRFQSEFLLNNVHLDAGDYYLKLSNGSAADGHDIGWGAFLSNSTPLTAWSGSSSASDFSGFRTPPLSLNPNVPAESFIINGTPDSGPSPAPEPATMLLLGLGMIGLAGARRFKK